MRQRSLAWFAARVSRRGEETDVSADMQANGRATLEAILQEVEQDPTLGGTPTNENTARAEEIVSTPESAPQSTADGESAGDDFPLGALLSNAGLLSKLPAMMDLMKQLRQPPEPYCSGKPTSAQCTSLLRALRPYLNQNRQRTVDTMIRISCLRDGISALR